VDQEPELGGSAPGNYEPARRTLSPTITDVLKYETRRISRFVQLDHMDWMRSYHPQALAEEWSVLLRRATQGARILFRSASAQPDFLDPRQVAHPHRPDQQVRVRDVLRYDRPLARRLYALDRAHTYASFHVADLVVP
jgi:S-adenosylmethionine-diacylglycerol 3-amino-3-carboxypropyl transferase